MRILISGASGLIGTALIPLLQSKGHQVSVLSTRKNNHKFATNVDVFYWNPEQAYVDEKALYGVDVIISLAGSNVAQRWTAKHKKSIFNSRVVGTRLLVDSLRKIKNHQIKHFLSASAIGIYPSNKTKKYDESELEIAPHFLGKVVTAWEAEVDKAVDLVPAVSKIRIGLVLARHGGALPPMAIPASFGFGSWFGKGDQWQSWIHIDDLARIFLFVLDHPGCFNGVAPTPVTQKKLVKAIAKTYGRFQWLPGIPKPICRLVLGEMSQVLLDSIHANSQAIQALGFEFQFPTIERALSDLLPLQSKN
ncbi:MAG: TIGR01777 family oxidoreductase [Flavobacteriaceae bacterium]